MLGNSTFFLRNKKKILLRLEKKQIHYQFQQQQEYLFSVSDESVAELQKMEKYMSRSIKIEESK